ncbi:MAG: ribosome biogenesis GTPase Der [Hyphomicrobium sp.]|jgi:GTP-binding protein|uniref:ribosome biogenesis GTPase Der n=1 Tax=Hyphomicrobium sp. TaxID=82 RepID=UPI0025BE3BCB|nr:ribosome biogenesis GTPase Der [Hyphomicrobium sp.]MBX9863865.1 ribosome biogenesis GTPase Der [Hyphomicrobium sp.]
MTPKIAIVGRPNVGKSTLFNRLTGSRDALVSDLPGLTRDRKEGAAELGGHAISLIDTAGLEVAQRGSIADRMRAQTEAAIEQADLVLFVIDARAGVTATDQTFATTVRASGRPVVLIANKCEGRTSDSGFYDAFKLGLGEPVAISAEHGLGLSDLERDAMAALGLKAKSKPKRRDGDAPEEEPAERVKPLRVAIVGRPNAGKSTLVNALIGEDRMITGPEPGLTRDTVATDIQWNGQTIKLFDTAGLRRRAKITELAEKLSAGDSLKAIRFAEVVVLLIDADRGLEHQDLSIGELVTEEGRALVIAVNKWDLIEDKQKFLKAMFDKISIGLAQVPGVAVVPISAASEKGLDKLLRAVVTASEIWNRRVATPKLNRWLQEALARHAPPAPSGRRLKIRYMTQPSTRPPTFVAFCTRPDALPQTYQRYLVNSLREAFDLPGVPIRLNLRSGDNPFAPKRRGG